MWGYQASLRFNAVPTANVNSPAEFAATSPLLIDPLPRNTLPLLVHTEKCVTLWLAESPVTATADANALDDDDAAENVAADNPAPNALSVPAAPGAPLCNRMRSKTNESNMAFFAVTAKGMISYLIK